MCTNLGNFGGYFRYSNYNFKCSEQSLHRRDNNELERKNVNLENRRNGMIWRNQDSNRSRHYEFCSLHYRLVYTRDLGLVFFAEQFNFNRKIFISSNGHCQQQRHFYCFLACVNAILLGHFNTKKLIQVVMI